MFILDVTQWIGQRQLQDMTRKKTGGGGGGGGGGGVVAYTKGLTVTQYQRRPIYVAATFVRANP